MTQLELKNSIFPCDYGKTLFSDFQGKRCCLLVIRLLQFFPVFSLQQEVTCIIYYPIFSKSLERCMFQVYILYGSSKIIYVQQVYLPRVSRGGSRAAATSKMERFVIIVNGWKPLTIITKRSILDVAADLDPPLGKTITETIRNYFIKSWFLEIMMSKSWLWR